MITLDNKQEIFDTVVEHLFKQGCQSMLPSGVGCAYRGKGNCKCAIGALIPDDEYKLEFENRPFTDIGLFFCDSKEIENLCFELVNMHDDFIDNSEDFQEKYGDAKFLSWEEYLKVEFKDIATRYNLVFNCDI